MGRDPRGAQAATPERTETGKAEAKETEPAKGTEKGTAPKTAEKKEEKKEEKGADTLGPKVRALVKQLDANDQGVVKVVDWMWPYALDQRTRDIHLQPRRQQRVIELRRDVVLHPVYQIPLF